MKYELTNHIWQAAQFAKHDWRSVMCFLDNQPETWYMCGSQKRKENMGDRLEVYLGATIDLEGFNHAEASQNCYQTID